MAGIQGQGSPSQLQSPIPGEDADLAALQAFATEGGDSDLGALQQFAMGSAAPAAAPVADQQIPPEEMSPLPAPEGWESAKEQMREVTARFRNSFAVTDNQQVDFLKSTGLFQEVRKGSDGGVLVKRPGRKGWEKFDRDKIELLGDTVDGARDVFEAIVENSFRIGGGIAGMMGGAAEGAAVGTATGPLAPVAAPTGAVTMGAMKAVAGASAAGAVGAVAARRAGDAVGKALGVPDDPNRDPAREDMFAAATGATFNMVSSIMARRAAAREARHVDTKRSVDYAVQKAKDAIADVAEVRSSTMKLARDFQLDPQQLTSLDSGVAELNDMASGLSKTTKFREMREKAAANVISAYDSLAEMVWARTGRSGAKVAEDFIISAKNIRQMDGQMVTEFKEQAAKELNGARMQANRFIPVINQLSETLNKPNGVERLAYEYNLRPEQAKAFAGEIKRWETYVKRTGGQMKIESAFKVQDQLTAVINNNYGTPLGHHLMKMRNAIRDDAIDGMDISFEMMSNSARGKELSQLFKAQKARYREVVGAVEGLGSVLEQDDFSREKLLDTLFKGTGSYGKAMNAKTLISTGNPQLWQQLSAEYFTRLRKQHVGKTGDVGWYAMSKQFGQLDERLQAELLEQVKMTPAQMQAFFRIGQRLENATVNNLANESTQGKLASAAKQAIILMPQGAGVAAKANVVKELLSGMGKDQALMKWYKNGGMEEVIRSMPGMAPSKRSELRAWIDGWTPTVVRTAKTPVRRRSEEE